MAIDQELFNLLGLGQLGGQMPPGEQSGGVPILGMPPEEDEDDELSFWKKLARLSGEGDMNQFATQFMNSRTPPATQATSLPALMSMATRSGHQGKRRPRLSMQDIQRMMEI